MTLNIHSDLIKNMNLNKELIDILSVLKRLRGIDFSNYRPSMFQRRVSTRLVHLGIDDYSLYLERLESDPTECDELIDAIAINVSAFFRDPIVSEIIAQNILPALLEKKSSLGQQELRLWSAGCAAGEEAFSLAILVKEAMKNYEVEWTTYLFGTDIDKNALKRAGKAVYSRDSLINTKLGVLDKYFEPVADGFKVKSSIRKMVHFSEDNLVSESANSPVASVFGEFDMILCRNLLIYFNRDLQIRIMRKFLNSLVPGGYLVLGNSEALVEEFVPRFRIVDSKNKIFKKLPN